jgi:GTP-binding protein Era
MTGGPGGRPASRAGFVALLGAPNAGKSTLVNQMVGTKVAIVSAKVQTTRSRVLGIAMHGGSQVALVDTPGIFEPRRRLDRAMVSAAWTSAGEADHVLVLIDAARARGLEEAQPILDKLAEIRLPATVALNKVDAVRREKLLDQAAALDATGRFDRIFMISALTGDGVGDLLDHLAAVVPKGPWLYPEDEVSDMPARLLAAEITREKLFNRLHQELPYALTVETETWERFENGALRIRQVIFVERDSQKAIILGKGGRMIRGIGTEARQELADILECPVHLSLFVKVRKGWADDPERYRQWGLDPRA